MSDTALVLSFARFADVCGTGCELAPLAAYSDLLLQVYIYRCQRMAAAEHRNKQPRKRQRSKR